MKYNKCTAAALAVALLAPIAGCSGNPAESSRSLSVSNSEVSKYSSTVAQLNPTTGDITLPLDAYAMNWDETKLVDSANDRLIDKCLRRSGFRNPIVDIDRSAGTRYADRRYGVWTDAEARYGYNLPPNPVGDRITKILQEQTPAWSAANDKCAAEVKQLPELTYSSAGAESAGSPIEVGARGADEAYIYASGTNAWKKARTDWWACLTREGLTPRTGPSEWGPEIPADPQSALRTAAIDVACKREVNLVQRLANLEAEYQAAFVQKNEAVLVAQRSKVDKELNTAKEILGVH